MSNSNRINCVTHNGKFHADEIVAVAILELVYGDRLHITRTRDTSIIEAADIAVDCGGVYDVARGRFDHHQREFFETYDDGQSYASAGLVWRQYGRDVINTSFYGVDVPFIDQLHDTITNGILKKVDAQDVGAGRNEFSEFISSFYPNEIDVRLHMQNNDLARCDAKADLEYYAFMEAVKTSAAYLRRLIESAAVTISQHKEACEALRHANSDGIVELNTPMSWFSAYDALNSDERDRVKLVVMQNDAGEWMVQSPSAKTQEGENFTRKTLTPAPQEMCGLSGQELTQVCGVEDAIFCHRNGFISSAKSKSGAYKMAMYILGK